MYNVRIAHATCAQSKLAQQATEKSVAEGLRFYSQTWCVELSSARNPCSVLSLILANRLSEEPDEDWCEEVAEHGLGPCKSVGRTHRWHRACRKIKVEEADDRTSRQEGVCVLVALHGCKQFGG